MIAALSVGLILPRLLLGNLLESGSDWKVVWMAGSVSYADESCPQFWANASKIYSWGNFWIVIVIKMGSSVTYSNDSYTQCGANTTKTNNG